MEVDTVSALAGELRCAICLSLATPPTARLQCCHCFCLSCIQQSLRHDPKCPLCKLPASRRDICRDVKLDRVTELFTQLEGAAMFATQAPTQKGPVRELPVSEPESPHRNGSLMDDDKEDCEQSAAPTQLPTTVPDSDAEPSPSRPLASLRASPSPAAQQRVLPLALASPEPLRKSARMEVPAVGDGLAASPEKPARSTGGVVSPAERDTHQVQVQESLLCSGGSPSRWEGCRGSGSPEPPSVMRASEARGACAVSGRDDRKGPQAQRGEGALLHRAVKNAAQRDAGGPKSAQKPAASRQARPCGRRVPARLQPWHCAACTFENVGTASRCSMCDTTKSAAVAQKSSNLPSLAPQEHNKQAAASKQGRLRLPRGMGLWTGSSKKASGSDQAARGKSTSAEPAADQPPAKDVESSGSQAQRKDGDELGPETTLQGLGTMGISEPDGLARHEGKGCAEPPQSRQEELERRGRKSRADSRKEEEAEQTAGIGKSPAAPSAHVSGKAAAANRPRLSTAKQKRGQKRSAGVLQPAERGKAGVPIAAKRRRSDPPPARRPPSAATGTAEGNPGMNTRPRSKSAQRPERAKVPEETEAGVKRPRSNRAQRQRVAEADQQKQPAVTRHQKGRCADVIARKPAGAEWSSAKRGWNFVASGLSTEERDLAEEVARKAGGKVFKDFVPNATHIICGHNNGRPAKRTMKLLMGIVTGKWLVGSSWLKACLAQGGPVPEEEHEAVVSDVLGSQSGPLLGRLHKAQGQCLLQGYQVCLQGSFTSKADLIALVKAAGAQYSKRLPPPPLSPCKGGLQPTLKTVILLGDAEQSDGTKINIEPVPGWEGACVSKDWLADSVLAYTIKSFASYVVK